MKRIMALGLIGLFAVQAGAQEVRYITDILQLGLHRAEDTSDSPFRNLVSGTEVAVLESVPNYARVRTEDGDEGWVKSAYLVEDKPARLRVAELETRLAELEGRLATAESERDEAHTDAVALIADAEIDLAAIEASRDTLTRLQRENTEYAATIETYRGALPWPWVAGALVLTSLAGFVAGWWWLDTRIRRRHGGFRVY